MFGVDPDIGSSALRLWVAAGSAALLVFVCALAFDWTRTRTVARVGVVVLGAVLGATLAWAFLDAAAVRDRSAERRALEARAAELNARKSGAGFCRWPVSNGLAGDDVEAACEKALFAAPATVASATSYVAARFALLADMVAYTRRGGGNIDSVLLPLRRSLEADRFGFVAHTLAVADGCTSDNCEALALLDNPSQVRANLSGQTLDRYLDHYLTAWAAAARSSARRRDLDVGRQRASRRAARISCVNIDFPSAASIPAISIMNPEPAGPPGAGRRRRRDCRRTERLMTRRRSSSRRARKPAPARPRRPLRRAAAPPAPPVDPVWLPRTEPAHAGCHRGRADGNGVAPAGAGPVQLNPFQPQPQASTGAARAQ